jgi:hypothetical protein
VRANEAFPGSFECDRYALMTELTAELGNRGGNGNEVYLRGSDHTRTVALLSNPHSVTLQLGSALCDCCHWSQWGQLGR